jgi:site-specific recombinase XerD
LNDYLDLFISHLIVEKGLSANTRSYSRDLALYLDFLEKATAEAVRYRSGDISAFMATLQNWLSARAVVPAVCQPSACSRQISDD